jgi:hypothetical protein
MVYCYEMERVWSQNLIFLCFKILKSPIDALLFKIIIINIINHVLSQLKSTMIIYVKINQESKGVFFASFRIMIDKESVFGKRQRRTEEETYIVCVNFCNDLPNCFFVSHIILLKGML